MDSVKSQRVENIRTAWSKRIDHIIGKQFGQLTVLSRAGSLNGAATWNCRCTCGNEVVVRGYVLRRGQQSCGCVLREKGHPCRLRNAARGSRSPRWKGGRFYRRGYVFLSNPDYPGKPEGKRYWCAREHVVIMSRHLGRPLLPHENVHHINGQRDDNRIENLELWSTSQPAGQRVEDKLKWAHDFIAQYEV